MIKQLFAACVVAGIVPLAAQAQEVKLRLAHFMPAASWQHTDLFEAWGKAVNEQSKGRIEVRVFPAQTLGKAVAGYDNAINRIAEVTWTVQGYTANRFPLSQIVELPGIFETAEQGSCAFQKLYQSGAWMDQVGCSTAGMPALESVIGAAAPPDGTVVSDSIPAVQVFRGVGGELADA